MIPMEITEACLAVSTSLGGVYIEMRVNYCCILMIVIGACMVTRQDVYVLVGCHEERHQQHETHRKHSDTTHGP